ncbi:MAG: zinc ribbon domain-containing protein [Clostridiaceae bacterium]|nr:zinc ribbon domain-containing protein [Clostridiaceae bacterium]
MFCPKCGFDIGEKDVNFCKKCGNPLAKNSTLNIELEQTNVTSNYYSGIDPEVSFTYGKPD